MLPEQALKYLNNSMSLRAPQKSSLELFAKYLQSPAGLLLLGRMNKDSRGNLSQILQSSREYFREVGGSAEFSDFERLFPAYTFALATGVGKTRLMGAFVAYLYLVYNIQHFMLVAPGNTIYRKLLDDFSQPNNPKYVFKGIEEINSFNVNIVTKDNYNLNRGDNLFSNKIEINIFNVQQFAQKDLSSGKGINKFGEENGQSYFDYLKTHEDLVVLLDEAHHYHADAVLTSLDTLDPLFGLEMTATPYLGTKGSGKNLTQIRMKNVLYNFNLGDAIRAKLVKDPWIGTEADTDFKQLDVESIETDARKLQLAAYFHERAKIALQEYALENKVQVVKPVLLVVAKDTEHASELKSLIDSDDFRAGEFKGKVIEIHTKLKGDEADENIEKLISLEDPENIIEVVIHVNMLKEGWDVTNVYTIAPLRQSAASILTEQTIGRGLRLPYGERTGDPLVDKLVIVAHEQYAKVLELAKDNELIQGQVEKIGIEESRERKEFVEVQPIIVQRFATDIRQNLVIMKEVEQIAQSEIDKNTRNQSLDESIKEQLLSNKKTEIITSISKQAINTNKSYQTQNINQIDYSAGSGFDLFQSFSSEAKLEIGKISETSNKETFKRHISVPRLILTPQFESLVIHDFNLDISVGRLRTYPNVTTILEQQLQAQQEITVFGDEVPGRRIENRTRVYSFGGRSKQPPQNMIISALLDFSLVDYDDPIQKPLLLKLTNQALEFYRSRTVDQDNLSLVVEANVRTIAEDIYKQILDHKQYMSENYEESSIGHPKPFLEEFRFSKRFNEQTVTLDSQYNTFSRDLKYGYFNKACHDIYTFDSSDEVRLAYLLEKDEHVVAWLRPAPNQFEGLYWRDEQGESHHKYEPDFVAELDDQVVMVEVKPESEINTFEVRAKKDTADKYCEVVNKNLGKYDISKPWKYIILTTNRISATSTVGGLLN